VRVLWSYDGDPHAVPVDAKARVLDVFGNPLNAEGSVKVGVDPVYMLVP